MHCLSKSWQEKNVFLIEHCNMLQDGNIIQDLLTDDKIHLIEKGVSILAGNIKRAIHECLNIALPPRNRSRFRNRSRNRTTQQRPSGRGRGRGLIQIAPYRP